jgi:hypothetical protein
MMKPKRNEIQAYTYMSLLYVLCGEEVGEGGRRREGFSSGFPRINSTDIGRRFDSATLQSMQWIINAAYNQRSLQSTPLYTV